MKCCKKTLVLAAVLAGGVALVATTGIGRHAMNKVAAWGQRQISPEVQIEGLKVDISRLDKDIDAGWPKIAKYETEIKELKKDLEDKQVKMTKMEKEIAAATDELEAKVVKVKYNGQEYSPSRAAKLLNDELNSFVSLKKYVASRTNLLSAREQKLSTAMARQKEMINQKGKLQAEVAQVEADFYPDKPSREEICEEIYRRTGKRPTVVQVKSARAQIWQKLRSFVERRKNRKNV